MSGRSRTLTYGLPVAGIAALVVGTGLVIDNRPVAPAELPPRQPTTAPALTGGSGSDGSGSGSSASAGFIGAIGVSEPPGESIAIAAHVAGVTAEVSVGVGDTVVRGQMLFRVDGRSAAAAVELARVQVAVAEAELARIAGTAPPAEARVRSAVAAVRSAEAAMAAVEADLADRQNQLRVVESLSDPRAVAAEEVDRRRFAVAAAEARVGESRARLAEAEAALVVAEANRDQLRTEDGQAGPELLAAEERVREAARRLESAEVDAALRVVRAPADGRVLQVNVRPGEYAAAAVTGDGLVVIGRTGPAHLRVEIDEVDVPRFSPTARAWASPRGDASRRVELRHVLTEPLLVPKANLSGRTSERVDTRVMQVVYALPAGTGAAALGQQFDVYVEPGGQR